MSNITNKLVSPKTYLTGITTMNLQGLRDYLSDTDQEEFLADIEQAQNEGLADGEILCSFYAKMCYASLTNKKNKNISKVRGIFDNIRGTIESGHGSVFEHCNINFITSNCSRVFTHELVRHRVGSAYSQTSGRYVRTDAISFVHDPILDSVKDEIEQGLEYLQNLYRKMEDKLGINDIKDFSVKKKLTSAMRRILPNGQANEIGFSLNLRSLRHLIELRTSRHAEWEIRIVFNQVYDLILAKFPAMFQDVTREMVDGAYEITFKNKKI
jgi:thymidylate synthase (FAD)